MYKLFLTREKNLYVSMRITNIFEEVCDFVGRRPFKRLPTDEAFSAELLANISFCFNEILPTNVLDELYNKDYSRVINLWTGFVTGYDEYLRAFR